MDIFDAEATARLLPYPDLARAVAAILALRRKGQVQAPARQHMALSQEGMLLIMPAATGDMAITKLITVHPKNSGLGLPTIQGSVLCLDPATGQPLGLLDGPTVTARRTAALTLLAASHLAAPQVAAKGPLLVVGAGTQARAHLEAFALGLGFTEALVCSRSLPRAQTLAREAEAWGMRVRVKESPAEVLDEALADVRIVVTATTSPTPVLPGQVPDGCFIAAVGAYTPHTAEIPASLVRRCTLYVDTLEGAMREAGDLLLAGVDFKAVTPLREALAKARPEPGPAPVLFKSVGHAMFDLAAARLAFGRG